MHPRLALLVRCLLGWRDGRGLTAAVATTPTVSHTTLTATATTTGSISDPHPLGQRDLVDEQKQEQDERIERVWSFGHGGIETVLLEVVFFFFFCFW